MNWVEIDLKNKNAIVPELKEHVLVLCGDYFWVAEYQGFIKSRLEHQFMETWEHFQALRHVTHWHRIKRPT